MSTNVHEGSATVYTFPLRGRFADAVQNNQSASATAAPSVSAPKAVFGEGWYHQEAIEAESTRKN